MLVEVAKIANSGEFDYLLIESTGVSEPMPGKFMMLIDVVLILFMCLVWVCSLIVDSVRMSLGVAALSRLGCVKVVHMMCTF